MIVEAAKLEAGEYREFRDGDLRIATSLETRPGADRLTVVLNGYCDRGTSKPPVFVLWPPAAPAFGHILRVCDPTLFMADWLRGSCFLGTESADPIPAILNICRTIARDVGVERRDVIYLGHSGAGFGALQCAIRDREAAAIVINPVAELGAYSEYKFATRLAQIFRPGWAVLDLCAEFPERLSTSAALKAALAAGKAPRIGLIQNMTDKTHFHPHYGAVCETLGLPITGGSDPSGRFHSLTYDKRGGHSMPPEMAVIEAMADRLLAARSASTRRAQVG
jgi:pimeloyl-ACP methyl ester carboxylesterase